MFVNGMELLEYHAAMRRASYTLAMRTMNRTINACAHLNTLNIHMGIWLHFHQP